MSAPTTTTSASTSPSSRRRSSRRAARSASSRAARRRPTTTSACRASATRSPASRAPPPPGDRLTGQNGWTEVDGCPLYTDDDFPRVGAADGGHPRQVSRPRRLHPDRRLPAVRAATPIAKVAEKYKDKIADGALALVVADTLPVQIDLMKEGLSPGQVGQRPFEMGYKAMFFLKDIKDGKAPPADPTYTGLDVCTPETADTCIGK